MKGPRCADEAGNSALELLLLVLVTAVLSPFTVAAADIPTAADDVDAAAAAAARVAALQRDADAARIVAVDTAEALLRHSRCGRGTLRVEPDVTRFEPVRAPGRIPEPGTVKVTVACTVDTGRRLGVPWMEERRVERQAEEDVDPFRSGP